MASAKQSVVDEIVQLLLAADAAESSARDWRREARGLVNMEHGHYLTTDRAHVLHVNREHANGCGLNMTELTPATTVEEPAPQPQPRDAGLPGSV